MATAKNINRSTDPNVRKSPPLSANAFPNGHVAKGNDGNYWTITEDGNGIKRWVKVNKTASKSSSTKSSTIKTFSGISQTASQKDALEEYNEETKKNFSTFYVLPKTKIPIFLDTSRNINEYSFVVGFDNQDFFIKVSKKLKGLYPVVLNVRVNNIRKDVTLTNFEFDPNADQIDKEKKDALNILDDFLYDQMNVRDGIQLPSTSQTASSITAVETQQEALDRFNTYLDNTLNIYYTLPKTNIVIYVDDKLNIRSFQALIGNNVVVDESDPDFKKQLQDWLSQRTVIKNPKIFGDSRADITDFTFEFDPNADVVEKEDELNNLDQWLYDEMNVRNGKQLPAPVQSSSTSSSNQLKKVQDIIAESGSYYLTMPRTGVKIYEYGNLIDNYEFVIQLDKSQDKYEVERNLSKRIQDLESIKKVTIAILLTKDNLLDVIFEFDNTAAPATKLIDISIIDNYLFDEIGIRPSITSTETAVQQAETKVDDIVFSAPVVPVGTEDQRNATDILVDEFIAKNENNLKKLAVENVGLLSTIDKTLEFIKAKFGTPATVTSVSNAVSNASKTANRPFEVGDVVKIKSDSQYFGTSLSNPANVEGVIIDIAFALGFPIKVKWANGKSNSYRVVDLEFVSQSVFSTPTQLSKQAPVTSGGSSVAGIGDTVTFYASREKTNLTGIVKSIVTGTDGKPYLRINVNGKFYLKQQGSVTKVK